MLTIGDKIPSFSLTSVVNADPRSAFETVTDQSFSGKWLVLFAWPKDFTFICPTEIVEFGKLNDSFHGRDAQLLGLSTDTDFVHLAWRQNHKDLTDSPFPWLADSKKSLSQDLGILENDEGICLRATFIIDPQGIIRYASANDLSVGRNPDEVLRILDALQSEDLCPCNWEKGDDHLKVA